MVIRRKWCFMVMIIMFWFSSSYVLAGDAFDSISSNREPQDALLIGKVVNKDSDNILNIKIFRVICGKLKESQIRYFNPEAAKNTSVGKYILLSIEKEDGFYKKCFSVCHEVTIKKGDKISDIRPLDQQKDEEWEISLQWFCNTGTMMIDARDSGKYYEVVDGVISRNLVYDINEHKWYKSPLSDDYSSPNTRKTKKINCFFGGLMLAVTFFIIIVLVVCFKRRVKKNN